MPNLMFILGFVYEIVRFLGTRTPLFWSLKQPCQCVTEVEALFGLFKIISRVVIDDGLNNKTMAREQLQSETVNALSRTSFIKNWVKVRKATKSITKATTSNLSFDQQCKHCEKDDPPKGTKNLVYSDFLSEIEETLEIKYIYEIQAHNVEPLEIRVTRK